LIDIASVPVCICFVGCGLFLCGNRVNRQFIVQYAGQLLSAEEGYCREKERDSVFRYFFNYNNKHYWLVRWLFNDSYK